MRVRADINIACLCAAFFAGSVGPVLHAQAQPSPQSSAPSSRDSSNDLFLTVGKSVLVDCAHPVVRISVGLGDIAEATATSPSEVLVNAKAPGETSLIVW